MSEFDKSLADPQLIPPVLQVSGLTISLPPGADRPNAVTELTLRIEASKTCCLVGESGSGKSVIAQTIMGLLPSGLQHVSGSLWLSGEDLLHATPARHGKLRGSRMGMVFQEPLTALNPVMRCGSQVDEVLKRHLCLSASARRERILKMFERVRFSDPGRIYESYPHQLSGGQRQRVAIAIAFVLAPALLICDEPTTALDVTTQEEILALIREMQLESGTAVLMITHDFGVVSDIADDVLVLRHGKTIERGPAASVLNDPQESYTRALLAAVPVIKPRTGEAKKASSELLRVRELSKSYTTRSWFSKSRPVVALEGVSLALASGETLGIVGESGSGKSTLARCIAQIIEPSAGSVVIAGHEVAGADRTTKRTIRRSVQMVFQDPYRSLNPRRTVGQSIAEGPINFGLSRDVAWQRAAELLELVRLDPGCLHRYPREFSGGQRQRICIARALACNPTLLVADEAVSGLDVLVQADVLNLLRDVQKSLEIGIVFITHDLRVASQICDSIVVMHDGRIAEAGSAQAVFFNPTHEYTRRLIAAVPGGKMARNQDKSESRAANAL